MAARIFSTIVLWAATALVIIFLKTPGLAFIIWLLSAVAIFETCKILFKMGQRPMFFAAQFFNAMIFAASWAGAHYGSNPMAAGALALALSVILLSFFIISTPYSDFFTRSFLPTLLILVAIPFMLQWLVSLASTLKSPSEYTGIMFSIWIICAAKFSDVGAYVLGSAFGHHKLAPHISPNKTFEGAVGGLFSSAAVSAGVAWLASGILPPQFTPTYAAAAGVAIGVSAMVSDLLESVLKRRADVKDSGGVIPGIGGALDLADSLVLAAPVGVLVLIPILK